MTLCIDGHEFQYEIENLCRVFFPDQKIEAVQNPEEADVFTGIAPCSGGVRVHVSVRLNGERKNADEMIPAREADPHEQERRMSVLLYGLLSQARGFYPQWGILTGVRPVKLFSRLAERMGENEAARYFEQKLLVSKEKTELCRMTSRNQQEILSIPQARSFSLYIAVPFCPTRCAYCSFVSTSVEKTFRLIPDYVNLLCKELRHTAEIAAQLGLVCDSVYVGGGTPTTLSAPQLKQVLDTVRNHFDLSACRELTVEAGRPDTVTQEKLDALRQGGTTRISINPQTLNDQVLRAIGRAHTTEQTLEAFSLARKCGFNNINMDLIVGLPKDSEDSFQRTLNGVVGLNPESITIHTLALKRASRLSLDPAGPYSGDAQTAQNMLGYADQNLLASGYSPYYLYRQSRMVGNLENTGWAKPGFKGYYNIFIMEEKETILACGAGAVTKLYTPAPNRLERIFNFKYPYEYINRFSEMMTRKDRVKEFYGSVSD
ncbi:MAG: coproporphyrinogen dehydrogenase HemZ [Oscillospiraceae bacterium]|jgi:oxygen-independent coproporphyrinogen-3 oxidase|nr:coproporphyrinogen dehydrogenase HemZ [Oscillospiraceae bacterium]